jgi:hypothetical protein
MPRSIHRLMVSEELFELSTVAIRARSLETQRYESINSVTADAAEAVIAGEYPIADAAAHLCNFEVDGPIRIHLVVNASWAGRMREALMILAEATGRRLSVKECLCILLNLVIENTRSKSS